MLQDIRFALRLLRKSPLFTATAALSLAVGIGANTTIFSLANALLLRPLPGLAEPERLVDLGRTDRGEGFDTVSHPYFRAVRERTRALSDVYALRIEPAPMSLAGRRDAERVYGTLVSGNYFTALGVQPVFGRLLRREDDVTPGGHAVTVLSHKLWERRFASDPSIVGQTILLSGHPFTVIGIAPRGFQGTTLLESDVWVPLAMVAQAFPGLSAGMLNEHRPVWLVMGGRLAEGVTLAQAQAEMDATAAGLTREQPDTYRDRGIRVARSAIVPGRVDMIAGFLAILMGIVGLVLLIACVNVAGMMLARGAARQREIAVRLAIGAGRMRLIRQLLTETAVLFVAAAALGIVLSRWLTSLILSLLPALPVPLALDIVTDWRVLAFAAGVAVITAVLSGLAPALQSARADLVPFLKSQGGEGGSPRLRLRNAFVVGQLTMSLLLLIAGGLFLRALQHAADIPAGFDQNRVDVVGIDLSIAGYTEETTQPFVRDLLSRIASVPGIASVSAAVDLPLDGGRFGLGGIRVPGRPANEPGIGADWNVVEPGYFETLRMRLVRGRDFAVSDTRAAPHVAIVNEAFARRVWPDRDPIGQRLERTDDGAAPLTVVGVAADAKLVALNDAAEPFIYVPLAQNHMSRAWIVVRRTGDASAVPAVRAALREMNPNLPVTEAMPLEDVTALGVIPQRVAAAVAGTLGVVGLILAAIGVYGVTAYSVNRRTREIGIRIALGADPRAVLSLVLRQGLILAACGIVLGVGLSAVASRLIESLLFGIAGLDPATFAGASAVFTLVTVVATYLPARRAAAVDPMVALRDQ